LEEDPRVWFRSLDDASIKYWNEFKKLLLEQWEVC